jgi:hypothetical protein
MIANTLNEAQSRAVCAIAEVGTGVAINRSTARALERRGLATIVGDASMAAGATMRLTNAGRHEATSMWLEIRRTAKTEHKRALAQRVVARLERELQAPPSGEVA